MSIAPIPTNRAAEKVPPILLAAQELSRFNINGGSIYDLADRASVGLLLDQIDGIAALLETAMAADARDDGMIVPPLPLQLNAAASGIRTLVTLAAFANEAADLAEPGPAQ